MPAAGKRKQPGSLLEDIPENLDVQDCTLDWEFLFGRDDGKASTGGKLGAQLNSMEQLREGDRADLDNLVSFFQKRVNIRRKTSRQSGIASSWSRTATIDGVRSSAFKFCSWLYTTNTSQSMLSALKDLSTVHEYAIHLATNRGNSGSTIARDGLRLAITVLRYKCGLDGSALSDCEQYKELMAVVSATEHQSTERREDWLQMRRKNKFATVSELKLAVWRIGKLMEVERGNKSPDMRRLAKLAYKRFLLAMCALKPIARTKDLYLLQTAGQRQERGFISDCHLSFQGRVYVS